MTFPLDHDGQIVWREQTTLSSHEFMQSFLNTVAHELKRVEAREIVVEGNRVSFSVAVFRLASNWNILCPIDKGVIGIIAGDDHFLVSFHVSYRRGVTCLTAVLGAFLLFLLIATGPSLGKVLWIGICWLWCVGGNYLINPPRFLELVMKQLKKAG